MLPGPGELIVILLIVIVVFGAKRIPEIMGGIGQGIKDFKRAVDTDGPQAKDTPSAAGRPAGTKVPLK